MTVNPITNLVSVSVEMPSRDTTSFGAMGEAFVNLFAGSMGSPVIERELNIRAREWYDAYAMVLPYRVRFSTAPASPASAARMRERSALRADLAAADSVAKGHAGRVYASQHLALEDIRVGKGEQYGQEVIALFGTLANRGSKSLQLVTLRVYFLDVAGRRIGEKEFSPVLVSEFSIGDNTPLRPGYRRDFSYRLDPYAPSGWSRRVDTEVTQVEFLAK